MEKASDLAGDMAISPLPGLSEPQVKEALKVAAVINRVLEQCINPAKIDNFEFRFDIKPGRRDSVVLCWDVMGKDAYQEVLPKSRLPVNCTMFMRKSIFRDANVVDIIPGKNLDDEGFGLVEKVKGRQNLAGLRKWFKLYVKKHLDWMLYMGIYLAELSRLFVILGASTHLILSGDVAQSAFDLCDLPITTGPLPTRIGHLSKVGGRGPPDQTPMKSAAGFTKVFMQQLQRGNEDKGIDALGALVQLGEFAKQAHEPESDDDKQHLEACAQERCVCLVLVEVKCA
jgi:hypothetical protein